MVLQIATPINQLGVGVARQVKIVTRLALFGTKLRRALTVAAIIAIGAATGPAPAFAIVSAEYYAPPVAQCKNATLTADANCTVTVTPGDVDDGSYDPNGVTVTMEVSPASLTGTGSHTVTLTVTGYKGALSTCTATVTVVDATPPDLTCPGNQTVNATGPTGTVVNYPAAAASDNCGSVTVGYSKDSGTLFPIGDTTVNVTATDVALNESTCSFKVHVKKAAEQINDLIAKVNALPDVKSPNKTALVTKLQGARAALAVNNTATGCGLMQDFINLVKAQKDKKLISAAAAVDLTADAARIRAVIGCP